MSKQPEVEFVTFKTEEFGDVTPCELVNSFPSLLSKQSTQCNIREPPVQWVPGLSGG
jgi:hypothetical protein